MIRHIQFSAKLLLLAFTVSSLPLAKGAGADPAVNANTNSNPNTSSFRVKPGPDDGRIAFLTAFLLEKIHFSQHSFDEEISSRFLDEYIESMDPQRLYFTQSDLAQFEHYRTNLETMTITRSGVADVTPAFEIFS